MKLRLYYLTEIFTSLILVGLVGCNSGSSSSYQVSGVASSGAPLAGVVVTATDADGRVVNSTASDKTGKYSITLNKQNTYVFTVPFNDIDGTPGVLSSIYFPSGDAENFTQVNLNPLTSLITSRVLGTILTDAPTAALIKNAQVTERSVRGAKKSIETLFQPVYSALAIPESESRDPISSTVYQAKLSDPLDSLFTLARFMVRTGTVTLGTGGDRIEISIPATGELISNIPQNSVNSLAALNAGATRTPIKNLIVIIGENRTFDSVFGTYRAPAGQTVKNLLSQGIVNADGTAGANFGLAAQKTAIPQTKYAIKLERSTPYINLPQPRQFGILLGDFTFQGGILDTRFPATLGNGPFQMTKYVSYAYNDNDPLSLKTTTGDPAHRFFQMWQQTGGDNSNTDLFTWVAVTAGTGGDSVGVSPSNPGQGGELMAFLNVNTGDLSYWNSLAQQYAMSDNYHQSIQGGTGANFFAIATADVPYYNVDGVPIPANQIENPNPKSGTDNFYEQDGYEGGSYVNCSDATQPGVQPILDVLARYKVESKCEANKFYLVNNYGLGYDMNGNAQPIGPHNYTLPPQTIPTIAEALQNKGVSWKWYTAARELSDVAAQAARFNLPATFVQSKQYNAIGDPLVASKNIMTSPTLRAGLAGLTSLVSDISSGTLPSVSFVVPTNLASGHPGFSIQNNYELFTKFVIDLVKSKPELMANTAIIVTTDEGGGYYDTGAIQIQDFFGDGPRIPMIIVSPYARTNFIDHSYYDHASILKFIERNWKLDPLSSRSRDNHPIPVTTSADPYMPINSTNNGGPLPTIGDLMTMFDF